MKSSGFAKWWGRNLPAKIAVVGGTLIATGTFFGVVRAHPLSAASPTSSPTATASQQQQSPFAQPTPSFNNNTNNTAPRQSQPIPQPRRSRRS